MKLVKTTETDMRIKQEDVLRVTINSLQFEVADEYPFVQVYDLGNEDKMLVDEIDHDDTPIVSDLDTLRVVALNWYFNNVEVVETI